MYKEKKRYPLSGTFELTARCNLSCKMCLVRLGEQQICESGKRERTSEEWIHMAEQAKDAGTIELLLTGGEVMLRPDFGEIYEAISKMGFVLSVYTNATMVTEKIMSIFRKSPPHQIGVTMYGASNETYEKMCGCKDGFDRFMDGVQKLSTLPSLLEVRTTIIKDNLCDLPVMREFVRNKFNRELVISRMVVDKVRGGIATPKKCRLSPEQNVELIHEKIVELLEQVRDGSVQRTSGSVEKLNTCSCVEDDGYLFKHCNAGINSYTITWNGNMYACELLNKGYTLPFDLGFENAWEILPEQYPINHKIEKCGICKFAALCDVCPATRLAETGDWFGIPEYYCQQSKYLHEILSELAIV